MDVKRVFLILLGNWDYSQNLKVAAQLMIMISFPDCAVSPRAFRAVVGGSEDLGVDDAQEENGDGVDDGDADQAHGDPDHIRGLVMNKVLGELRVQALED